MSSTLVLSSEVQHMYWWQFSGRRQGASHCSSDWRESKAVVGGADSPAVISWDLVPLPISSLHPSCHPVSAGPPWQRERQGWQEDGKWRSFSSPQKPVLSPEFCSWCEWCLLLYLFYKGFICNCMHCCWNCFDPYELTWSYVISCVHLYFANSHKQLMDLFDDTY